MQPVGQALAQLVGLWVLLGREKMYGLQAMQCGLNTKYEDECKRIVDGIWRIVIGSGAAPALLAIIFRFFLYDCGLYSLEVKNKAGMALKNTQRVYGAPPESINGFAMNTHGEVYGSRQTGGSQPMPLQFSKQDLYKYLITEGNWYYLLGMLKRAILQRFRVFLFFFFFPYFTDPTPAQQPRSVSNSNNR